MSRRKEGRSCYSFVFCTLTTEFIEQLTCSELASLFLHYLYGSLDDRLLNIRLYQAGLLQYHIFFNILQNMSSPLFAASCEKKKSFMLNPVLRLSLVPHPAKLQFLGVFFVTFGNQTQVPRCGRRVVLLPAELPGSSWRRDKLQQHVFSWKTFIFT